MKKKGQTIIVQTTESVLMSDGKHGHLEADHDVVQGEGHVLLCKKREQDFQLSSQEGNEK